jgi:hypothetical protein
MYPFKAIAFKIKQKLQPHRNIDFEAFKKEASLYFRQQ